MPPKTAKEGVNRPFGLSENEVVFALHACKLYIQEGKVDKARLAAELGRDNQDSCLRIWQMAKNKLTASSGSQTLENGADGETSTKQTPKRKNEASGKKGGKKRAKKEDHVEKGAQDDENPDAKLNSGEQDSDDAV